MFLYLGNSEKAFLTSRNVYYNCNRWWSDIFYPKMRNLFFIISILFNWVSDVDKLSCTYLSFLLLQKNVHEQNVLNSPFVTSQRDSFTFTYF